MGYVSRDTPPIIGPDDGRSISRNEYLIGEDILSSNQQQIIEQARFSYSPLGKAFKKQIKTIEDQGEKKIRAIQDKGKVKAIKKYAYDGEDTPFISKKKKKEIFNELVDEKRGKVTDLDKKKVNSDDLMFDNALNIINKILNGEINLADVKNNQEKFKSNLGETKRKQKT